MKAFDAKRSSQPIEITTETKAWHLTVIAHPARSGMVQAISLRSGKGDAVPSDQFVVGPPAGPSVDGADPATSPTKIARSLASDRQSQRQVDQTPRAQRALR
jgi:hypothetical protein